MASFCAARTHRPRRQSRAAQKRGAPTFQRRCALRVPPSAAVVSVPILANADNAGIRRVSDGAGHRAGFTVNPPRAHRVSASCVSADIPKLEGGHLRVDGGTDGERTHLRYPCVNLPAFARQPRRLCPTYRHVMTCSASGPVHAVKGRTYRGHRAQSTRRLERCCPPSHVQDTCGTLSTSAASTRLKERLTARQRWTCCYREC